jgi:hypothetical protein
MLNMRKQRGGNIVDASLAITCVTLGALRKLQGGWGGGTCPSNIFLPKERFLATELKRGK